MQPQTGKSLHAERQERFPDVKAGEFVTFEYDHATAGAGEKGRGDTAGRPTADNRHVV